MPVIFLLVKMLKKEDVKRLFLIIILNNLPNFVPIIKRKDLTDCNLIKNAKAVLCRDSFRRSPEKTIPPLVSATIESFFKQKRNGVFIYIGIRK
jgi:hypothetical protein